MNKIHYGIFAGTLLGILSAIQVYFWGSFVSFAYFDLLWSIIVLAATSVLASGAWLFLVRESRRFIGAKPTFLFVAVPIWLVIFRVNLLFISVSSQASLEIGYTHIGTVAVFSPLAILFLGLGLRRTALLPLVPIAFSYVLFLFLAAISFSVAAIVWVLLLILLNKALWRSGHSIQEPVLSASRFVQNLYSPIARWLLMGFGILSTATYIYIWNNINFYNKFSGLVTLLAQPVSQAIMMLGPVAIATSLALHVLAPLEN